MAFAMQASRGLRACTLLFTLTAPLAAQSHELDLTAVILRGSNWNRNRVEDHLERTRRIFAACGVELDDVAIVETDGPGGRHDLDFATPVPGSQIPQDVYDFASALPPETAWPVVVFAGRLEGIDDLARSFQRGPVPDDELFRYPYMNTAWIAYKTHWIERREDEYSSVAHELGHLLCECGHKGGERRHLLHEFRNFLGAEVLPEHCAAFRRSPLVRPSARR